MRIGSYRRVGWSQEMAAVAAAWYGEVLSGGLNRIPHARAGLAHRAAQA